jgi:hypothetical protein
MRETKISGAEVPKETIVKPMSSGDMPEFLAVAAAPITKRSALQTKTTSPASIDKIGNSMADNKPVNKKAPIKTEPKTGAS